MVQAVSEKLALGPESSVKCPENDKMNIISGPVRSSLDTGLWTPDKRRTFSDVC